MYVCMYTYMYNVHVHVCMHVCLDAHVHVHIHVCTCTCTCHMPHVQLYMYMYIFLPDKDEVGRLRAWCIISLNPGWPVRLRALLLDEVVVWGTGGEGAESAASKCKILHPPWVCSFRQLSISAIDKASRNVFREDRVPFLIKGMSFCDCTAMATRNCFDEQGVWIIAWTGGRFWKRKSNKN